MARPFVFPDPNDRSPNAPSVIVSATQILGLYNQENDFDKMERVTEKVQIWFKEQAQTNQWDTANFSGNQCVLAVKLQVRPLP